MIENPDQYITGLCPAGANDDLDPSGDDLPPAPLADADSPGGRPAGLVLNPATPLGYVEEALEEIDYVLLMSVNPGFGGQKFIPALARQAAAAAGTARRVPGRRGRRVRIEIDGGIVPGNIAEVAAAGAEIFVAGSSVFGQPDPAAAVRELLRRGPPSAA
jgi:ribulose-phosphate 3-epimerase